MSKPSLRMVAFRLSQQTLDELEVIAKALELPSRSEALRAAVRRLAKIWRKSEVKETRP